jgi:hypothetical protein
MVAEEIRREVERGIGANVGVEDSWWGTRGQLVGGTVEGQVDDFESRKPVRAASDQVTLLCSVDTFIEEEFLISSMSRWRSF